MSLHHIHAIHDPDGAELECRIHYAFHAAFPGRYHVDPTPPEPASIEFVRVEIFVLGQWVEMPKLDEWAEAYLLGDGLDDAMRTAAEDAIEAAESRAEARAGR